MAKQVVTFHYELRDESGVTIDSSREGEPLSFLEGSGQIIPGLELALLNFEQGKVEEILVPYQEAYGPYYQELIAQVPRQQFPSQELKAGDIFEVQKEGTSRLITVVDVNDEMVTIDGNHPLAGKNLLFFVEVMARRDATAEEITHGHVHQGQHPHS